MSRYGRTFKSLNRDYGLTREEVAALIRAGHAHKKHAPHAQKGERIVVHALKHKTKEQVLELARASLAAERLLTEASPSFGKMTGRLP